MAGSEEVRPQPLGCWRHGEVLLVLQLLSATLLTGLLVAVLGQGYKDPDSHGKETIYQKLSQLKAGVDRLCRPCPWEWMLFQGSCYFFSKSQRTWNDSITACEEVGAQLVIIHSEEEKTFLQVISPKERSAWIGLSDTKQEGVWRWVDGSLLLPRFEKFWKTEPAKNEVEDCAETSAEGWNAYSCELEKFWICKKSEAPCSGK